MSANIHQEPYRYYNDICDIICEIIELHKDFCHNFDNMTEEKLLNLNKKQIRHICEVAGEEKTFMLKTPFHTLLKDCLRELNSLTVDIDLDYVFKEYDLRLRVKQNESIVNKIKYYQVGKGGEGSYAINKCLNDLLGFRICIQGFKHDCERFKNLCEKLEDKYKIKYMDASKGNYRATHVYFYGESNKNFPWELQIWHPDDFESNDESHKHHKQEYVDWASDYKNSFEENGGDR